MDRDPIVTAPDPFISVFMAVRNEEKAIERCLTSFLEQSYPRNKFELVIADKSEDGTAGILQKYSSLHPETIRVLDNSGGRTVDGLNLSLMHCRGQVVVLYIGHAYPEKDFLSAIADATSNGEVGMAGGRVIPESRTGKPASESIAMALRHPYSVGKNSFTMREKQSVKTMHWMAVKRDLADRVGLFNTRYSPRGEDCDWYERVLAAGGKAIFDPSIVSHYFVRETFFDQFMIQVKNGYYRMQPFFDSGRGARAHHLAPLPAILLIAIVCLLAKSAVPAAVLGVSYLLITMIMCCFIAHGKIRYWPLVLNAVILIHAGHCIGIIAGTARFAPRSCTTRLAALIAGRNHQKRMEA